MFARLWPYLILLITPTATQAQGTFFPDGIPLAVRSPYLNVWYRATDGQAALPDDWPWFWPFSHALGWSGLIRVDNVTYNWLGDNIINNGTANLTGIQITPTRSMFLLQAGPVDINVTFLSPIEPSDWVKQSQPFSYLSIDVMSRDGLPHSVQMYSSITAEWVSGYRDGPLYVNWTQPQTPSSFSYGIVTQNPTPNAESNAQADDGTAYYTTATDKYPVTWQIDVDKTAILQFMIHGALLNTSSVTPSQAINQYNAQAQYQGWFVFATVIDLGSIISTSDAPALYAVGYARDPSVLFTNASGGLETRRPYYVTQYDNNTPALIEAFVSDFPDAYSRAVALDSRIIADAGSVSSNYVDLVSLGARQALGALDITTSSTGDPTDVLVFMKDIGTSNRVNPVERMFAAFPVYLYLNASLCGAMLKPLLISQDFQPTQPYAAQDIGSQYPIASGQRGDPTQGVEQTGNMLIMLYAYARFSGDGTLLAEHYNLTKGWADYLVNNTLIFSDQVSADGETNANMTNLAIKGIIGVKAMAEISRALGAESDAELYDNATMGLLVLWESLAQSSTQSHLLGSYGEQQSWALMYNIYADKLLDTNLVPQQIMQGQTSYYTDLFSTYPSTGNYGLPIDSVLSPNASASWMMFTAGTVTDSSVRDRLVSSVWSRASLNTTDGAFVNKYDYQSGALYEGNGTASPALGAVFSLLALNLNNVTIKSNMTIPSTTDTGPSSQGSNSSRLGPIIGGVIGVVCAIAIAIATCLLWRKKRRQHQRMDLEIDSDKEQNMAQHIYRPSPFPYDRTTSMSPAFTPIVNVTVHSKRQLSRQPSDNLSEEPSPEAEEAPQADEETRTETGAASMVTPSDVIGLRTEVENLRQVMRAIRTERLEPPPEYRSEYATGA